MSIYRLSKESEVSSSTLYDFLISKKTKLLGIYKINKIATTFGVPCTYFLDDNQDISDLKSKLYNYIPDENIRLITMAGEYMTKE